MEVVLLSSALWQDRENNMAAFSEAWGARAVGKEPRVLAV
jgi:hypothetical protein